MSAITIRSYDFANGNVIAGATGQAAKVTIWDSSQGDSEGIEFFDQQTVPVTFVNANSYGVGLIGAIIAAPAVGRIRLYEARMYYYFDIAHPTGDQYGIYGSFYVSGGQEYVGLEISPASPVDYKVITAPGGDLPIGLPLILTLDTVDGFAVSTNGIRVSIRYAVI
jgi:hypothetical protein